MKRLELTCHNFSITRSDFFKRENNDSTVLSRSQIQNENQYFVFILLGNEKKYYYLLCIVDQNVHKTHGNFNFQGPYSLTHRKGSRGLMTVDCKFVQLVYSSF